MALPTLESLGIDKDELTENTKRVRLYNPSRMGFIMDRATRLTIPGGEIIFLAQSLCTDREFIEKSKLPKYHPWLFSWVQTALSDYLLSHS